MLENKEELKNKIIYRASYRGSKEMDILMTNFVKSLIDNLLIFEFVFASPINEDSPLPKPLLIFKESITQHFQMIYLD